MSTVLTQYTPEDLLTMPDGDLYELVDGELVEQKMGARSSWTAGQTFLHISTWNRSEPKGWVFPENTSFQCFMDDLTRTRRADTAFVRFGRFEGEQLPQGHIRIAPDLAVEVISPHDLYYEVERKVEEYLAAGVLLVWVVNPDSRIVMVYRPNGGEPSRLTDGDVLSGDDVLPGFECPVADLLPPRYDDA